MSTPVVENPRMFALSGLLFAAPLVYLAVFSYRILTVARWNFSLIDYWLVRRLETLGLTTRDSPLHADVMFDRLIPWFEWWFYCTARVFPIAALGCWCASIANFKSTSLAITVAFIGASIILGFWSLARWRGNAWRLDSVTYFNLKLLSIVTIAFHPVIALVHRPYAWTGFSAVFMLLNLIPVTIITYWSLQSPNMPEIFIEKSVDIDELRKRAKREALQESAQLQRLSQTAIGRTPQVANGSVSPNPSSLGMEAESRISRRRISIGQVVPEPSQGSSLRTASPYPSGSGSTVWFMRNPEEAATDARTQYVSLTFRDALMLAIRQRMRWLLSGNFFGNHRQRRQKRGTRLARLFDDEIPPRPRYSASSAMTTFAKRLTFGQGTILYLISVLVLGVYAVLSDYILETGVGAAFVTVGAVLVLDVVIFLSIYGRTSTSPFAISSLLALARLFLILCGQENWPIGHALMYLCLGLYLGFDAIDVVLPDSGATAVDQERIRKLRQRGLGAGSDMPGMVMSQGTNPVNDSSLSPYVRSVLEVRAALRGYANMIISEQTARVERSLNSLEDILEAGSPRTPAQGGIVEHVSGIPGARRQMLTPAMLKAIAEARASSTSGFTSTLTPGPNTPTSHTYEPEYYDPALKLRRLLHELHEARQSPLAQFLSPDDLVAATAPSPLVTQSTTGAEDPESGNVPIGVGGAGGGSEQPGTALLGAGTSHVDLRSTLGGLFPSLAAAVRRSGESSVLAKVSIQPLVLVRFWFVTITYVAEVILTLFFFADESGISDLSSTPRWWFGVITALVTWALLLLRVVYRVYTNAGFTLTRPLIKWTLLFYVFSVGVGVFDWRASGRFAVFFASLIVPALLILAVGIFSQWQRFDYSMLRPSELRVPPHAPLLRALFTGGLCIPDCFQLLAQPLFLILSGLLGYCIDLGTGVSWLGTLLVAGALVIIITVTNLIEWFMRYEIRSGMKIRTAVGCILFFGGCTVAFYLNGWQANNFWAIWILVTLLGYPCLVALAFAIYKIKDDEGRLSLPVIWCLVGVYSLVFFFLFVAASVFEPWYWGALSLGTLLSVTFVLMLVPVVRSIATPSVWKVMIFIGLFFFALGAWFVSYYVDFFSGITALLVVLLIATIVSARVQYVRNLEPDETLIVNTVYGSSIYFWSPVVFPLLRFTPRKAGRSQNPLTDETPLLYHLYLGFLIMYIWCLLALHYLYPSNVGLIGVSVVFQLLLMTTLHLRHISGYHRDELHEAVLYLKPGSNRFKKVTQHAQAVAAYTQICLHSPQLSNITNSVWRIMTNKECLKRVHKESVSGTDVAASESSYIRISNFGLAGSSASPLLGLSSSSTLLETRSLKGTLTSPRTTSRTLPAMSPGRSEDLSDDDNQDASGEQDENDDIHSSALHKVLTTMSESQLCLLYNIETDFWRYLSQKLTEFDILTERPDELELQGNAAERRARAEARKLAQERKFRQVTAARMILLRAAVERGDISRAKLVKLAEVLLKADRKMQIQSQRNAELTERLAKIVYDDNLFDYEQLFTDIDNDGEPDSPLMPRTPVKPSIVRTSRRQAAIRLYELTRASAKMFIVSSCYRIHLQVELLKELRGLVHDMDIIGLEMLRRAGFSSLALSTIQSLPLRCLERRVFEGFVKREKKVAKAVAKLNEFHAEIQRELQDFRTRKVWNRIATTNGQLDLRSQLSPMTTSVPHIMRPIHVTPAAEVSAQPQTNDGIIYPTVYAAAPNTPPSESARLASEPAESAHESTSNPSEIKQPALLPISPAPGRHAQKHQKPGPRVPTTLHLPNQPPATGETPNSPLASTLRRPVHHNTPTMTASHRPINTTDSTPVPDHGNGSGGANDESRSPPLPPPVPPPAPEPADSGTAEEASKKTEKDSNFQSGNGNSYVSTEDEAEAANATDDDPYDADDFDDAGLVNPAESNQVHETHVDHTMHDTSGATQHADGPSSPPADVNSTNPGGTTTSMTGGVSPVSSEHDTTMATGGIEEKREVLNRLSAYYLDNPETSGLLSALGDELRELYRQAKEEIDLLQAKFAETYEAFQMVSKLIISRERRHEQMRCQNQSIPEKSLALLAGLQARKATLQKTTRLFHVMYSERRHWWQKRESSLCSLMFTKLISEAPPSLQAEVARFIFRPEDCAECIERVLDRPLKIFTATVRSHIITSHSPPPQETELDSILPEYIEGVRDILQSPEVDAADGAPDEKIEAHSEKQHFDAEGQTKGLQELEEVSEAKEEKTLQEVNNASTTVLLTQPSDHQDPSVEAVLRAETSAPISADHKGPTKLKMKGAKAAAQKASVKSNLDLFDPFGSSECAVSIEPKTTSFTPFDPFGSSDPMHSTVTKATTVNDPEKLKVHAEVIKIEQELAKMEEDDLARDLAKDPADDEDVGQRPINVADSDLPSGTEIEEMLERLKAAGLTSWVDERFANDKALYFHQEYAGMADWYYSAMSWKWRSLRDWIVDGPNAKKPLLVDDRLSPDDIRQGALGDCYFLSALAVLTLRPELFSNVFITSSVSNENIYAFKFLRNGVWVTVLIDDRIPFTIDPTTGDTIPAFARSENKSEMWPVLIEKAYAKLYGSYQAIEGGQVSDALVDMTGGVAEILDFKSDPAIKEKVKDGTLWVTLLEYARQGYLLGADSPEGDESSGIRADTEEGAKLGIIQNHAYSILRVEQIDNVQLLQLRNPWGRKEWTGDWSDDSPLWNSTGGRRIKVRLGHEAKDDGKFWMSWKDFTMQFSKVQVCKVFHSALWPERGEFRDIWSQQEPNMQFSLLPLSSTPTKIVITLEQDDVRGDLWLLREHFPLIYIKVFQNHGMPVNLELKKTGRPIASDEGQKRQIAVEIVLTQMPAPDLTKLPPEVQARARERIESAKGGNEIRAALKKSNVDAEWSEIAMTSGEAAQRKTQSPGSGLLINGYNFEDCYDPFNQHMPYTVVVGTELHESWSGAKFKIRWFSSHMVRFEPFSDIAARLNNESYKEVTQKRKERFALISAAMAKERYEALAADGLLNEDELAPTDHGNVAEKEQSNTHSKPNTFDPFENPFTVSSAPSSTPVPAFDPFAPPSVSAAPASNPLSFSEPVSSSTSQHMVTSSLPKSTTISTFDPFSDGISAHTNPLTSPPFDPFSSSAAEAAKQPTKAVEPIFDPFGGTASTTAAPKPVSNSGAKPVIQNVGIFDPFG